MSSQLIIGMPLEQADFVFLLPNLPIIPNEDAVQQLGYVPALIELNGNHWRKILTIMAKLTSAELKNWRPWRDEMLMTKVTMVFSSQWIESIDAKVFIVGNGFREQVVVPDEAQSFGERHRALVADNRIWCPYLDYRQFPNVLVDELRLPIHNHSLESACFMC